MLKKSLKQKKRALAGRSLLHPIRPTNVDVLRSAASLFVATLVNQLTPSSALAQTAPGMAFCSSATLNWMAGAYRCSAPSVSLASGRTLVLQDNTAPNTGVATFSCTNGIWAIQPGASCVRQSSDFSESDPVGSAAKRLDAIVLSDSQPGFVGTKPLPGTTTIANPSAGADGFATAEMLAVKKRLDEDKFSPINRWWATSMEPQVTVMEPGQSVTVDVMKVDVNGVAYEPVKTRADIELTVKWQRVDGTIVSGFGSARFVADGKLVVTAPSNAGIGRMLVSVKNRTCADFCYVDAPGDAKLSALFSGEVLAVKGHAIKLAEAGQVQLPLANGAINSKLFTTADLKAAMLAFRASKTDRLDAIGYPLVISGAAPIAAGKVVDLRLQGIPMGGTVVSSVTRGAEQMLVIALDPAEAYMFAKYSDDAIYAAGLLAPNPIWTYNSDPKQGYVPGQQAAAASLSRTSPTAAAPSSTSPCGSDFSASMLSLLPVLNLYKGELGLYVGVQLSGTGQVACKWDLGMSKSQEIASTIAGALVAAPALLIAGRHLKPKPFGELKIKGSFAGDRKQQLSYMFGLASGEKYGPKSELKLPVLSSPLSDVAFQVKGEMGGEIGLKSEIAADATGGAIGLSLQLANRVTGDSPGDDAISLKTFVNVGLSTTLPNAPMVYATGSGAEVKLATKAGVSAKLPKLLLKYMDSIALSSSNVGIKGDLAFDATIAEAGVKMAFDATVKPRSKTTAQLTTLTAKAAAAASSLLAYDKPAKRDVPLNLSPRDGIAAPERKLSFLGNTVAVGGNISGTSAECQDVIETPFISNIGPMLGMSGKVRVCSPDQKAADVQVNDGVKVADGFDKNKEKVITYIAYGEPSWSSAPNTVYSPRPGNYSYNIVFPETSNGALPLLAANGPSLEPPYGYIPIRSVTSSGIWGLYVSPASVASGGPAGVSYENNGLDSVDLISVYGSPYEASQDPDALRAGATCQLIINRASQIKRFIPNLYCSYRGQKSVFLVNVDAVNYGGSNYFRRASPFPE